MASVRGQLYWEETASFRSCCACERQPSCTESYLFPVTLSGLGSDTGTGHAYATWLHLMGFIKRVSYDGHDPGKADSSYLLRGIHSYAICLETRSCELHELMLWRASSPPARIQFLDS